MPTKPPEDSEVSATAPPEMMDFAARQDSVVANALVGLGDPEYDRSLATVPSDWRRLSRHQLEALFMSRTVRNICEAYPSRATQKWTELSIAAEVGTGKSKKKRSSDTRNAHIIQKLREYENRLGVKQAFYLADLWANIYGGAVIFIITDDAAELEEPIDTQNLRSIIGLEPLDRYDAIPDLVNADPLHPTHYWLLMNTGQAKRLQGLIQMRRIEDHKGRVIGLGTRVHASRFIRFDGLSLPPRLMLRNDGWGQSLIEAVWDAVRRYESSFTAAENMLLSADMFVRKIQGFNNMVVNEESKGLAAILRSQQRMLSVLRGLVIDAEDDVLFPARNLGMIDGILMRMRDHLLSVTNMSHTFVFGESPSGLGATGESEERTDAIRVNEYQEREYRPKLLSTQVGSLGIYDLILAAKDGPTKGKPIKGLELKFVSLFQSTPAQDAGLRAQDQMTFSGYINAGVLTKEEVRKSLFGSGKQDYPSLIHIDSDELPTPEGAEAEDPSARLQSLMNELRGEGEEQEDQAPQESKNEEGEESD